MYPNPEMLRILAQEYRGEQLRQAEITRLLKEAQPRKAGPCMRLLLKLGDFLIAFGLWLKTRYAATGQSADTSVLHAS